MESRKRWRTKGEGRGRLRRPTSFPSPLFFSPVPILWMGKKWGLFCFAKKGRWFVPFALLCKSKVAYKLAYFLLCKKSASPFLLCKKDPTKWGEKQSPIKDWGRQSRIKDWGTKGWEREIKRGGTGKKRRNRKK